MRGVVMVGPGDVRIEELDEPQVTDATDAVIRLLATCICGSDLWRYRGIVEVDHQPMGHEYVGVVEEVGDAVTTVTPGDQVIGSFAFSDGTCELCRSGLPSSCVDRVIARGMQAERARVQHADGTLIRLPAPCHEQLLPHLLAASDVLGTGWFGADAAGAGPGRTVVVVGDGAVGLMAVLAASEMGSERVIAMSRHGDRQELARTFGATDVVEERGSDGVAAVRELTAGLGAHAVVEAVGTQESVLQAIGCTRPGGRIGLVGVPHEVALPAIDLFFAQVNVFGGPAPVRRYLPDLVAAIYDGRLRPGPIFDLTLPLADAADGYRAMDERSAVKVMLTL